MTVYDRLTIEYMASTNDREELNARMMLLKDYIETGKLQFIKDKEVIESLKKVRYSSDGKVNPNTVDSLVRSLAKTVSWMKYEEDLRKIPLKQIQEEYFHILELYFEHPYQEMLKHNVSPHVIAMEMSEKPSLVKALSLDAENFKNGILEFWQTFGDAVRVHIQDLKGLKTIYGGDIFPSYRKNTLSSAGLYVDTTILPDPMLRVASFMKYVTPEKAAYYLAKHAISALSLKDLVLADVNPPLAIIAPDPFILDEHITKFIASVGEQDVLTHLEYAFGMSFKNTNDLNKYVSGIKTAEELEKKLKEPERILFDTDWAKLPFLEQWKKSQDGSMGISYPKGYTVGEIVKFSMIGRMMQIGEMLYKANSLHGVPFIDAPTSWKYFLWKYEYDRDKSEEVNLELKNIMLVNALQNNRLEWLGNVPHDALIKLRQEGALNELRELFSKGIVNIQDANEKTYQETVGEVIGNINNAFFDHMKILKEHSNGVKKYFGFDIAPWLVAGGISIAAASTGNVPISVTSALAGIIGVTSGKDLWKKGKELLDEKNKLSRSPVGLLFEAREQ